MNKFSDEEIDAWLREHDAADETTVLEDEARPIIKQLRQERDELVRRDGAMVCAIAEQIVDDGVSGLAFRFKRRDDGGCVMVVYGDIPCGNREFIFDLSGKLGATGTAMSL